MKPKIYLFSAKANHGKDSACDYIKKLLENDNKKVVHTLYAKYIKQYAKDYFGWDGREETKPRELLQFMGTDIIRERLKKPNFHVDRICDDIEILSDYFDAFLISDVRFPNEIEIPKSKFGDSVVSVRIIRTNFTSPLTLEQQQHKSETALDEYTDFDYVIEASNLDELYSQIDKIYLENKSEELNE